MNLTTTLRASFMAALLAAPAAAMADDDGKKSNILPWAVVPEAAQKAITANAGGGEIAKVVEITRGGKTTYRATVEGTGKKIAVTAEGELVTGKGGNGKKKQKQHHDDDDDNDDVMEAKQISAALEQAPQPVRDAVRELARGKEIEEFWADTVLGTAVHVVELDVEDGADLAFGLTPDGQTAVKWVEVEEPSLPAPVTAAALKAHPGGDIDDTFLGTMGNQTFYDLENKVAGTRYLMRISPDGGILHNEVKAAR